MPIYEYQCCKCSHRFEVIHGISDEEVKRVCPKCGAPRPERVLSTFSCGGAKTEAGSGSVCAPKPGRFT